MLNLEALLVSFLSELLPVHRLALRPSQGRWPKHAADACPLGITSFFWRPGPAWLTLTTSRRFSTLGHLNIAAYRCSPSTRANLSPLIFAVHAHSSLSPDRQNVAPGFEDALRLLSSNAHFTRSPRLVFWWTSTKDSCDFHHFEILILEAAFSLLLILLALIPKLPPKMFEKLFC